LRSVWQRWKERFEAWPPLRCREREASPARLAGPTGERKWFRFRLATRCKGAEE
jgi:hypothetical protein